MNVSFIGLGKLGLPLACCLAQAGNKILGVDKNEYVLDKLSNKELNKVKESIIEESWEDDAISCSGFYLTLESSETVYVTFTGPNEGQGGYRAEFEKIFASREDAYKFYSQKGYDFMDL